MCAKMNLDKDSNNPMVEMLDTPWIHNHVETHLVFGPLVKKSLGGLFIVLALLTLLIGSVIYLFAINSFDIRYYIHPTPIILLIIGIYFAKPSGFYLAAGLWCVIKFSFLIISFAMMIAGGLVGLMRGNADAPYLFMLAIVWFPSIEFFPKLTPNQKYITLLRIIFSVPLIYLGYKAGLWKR